MINTPVKAANTASQHQWTTIASFLNIGQNEATYITLAGLNHIVGQYETVNKFYTDSINDVDAEVAYNDACIEAIIKNNEELEAQFAIVSKAYDKMTSLLTEEQKAFIKIENYDSYRI